jgi:hypothetical protein
MSDFFINLLFGHLFGDYVLQNNWMALSKNRIGFNGWFVCTVHCFIYTITCLIFTMIFSWKFALLVFISHFLIDKFSLADKWLVIIKGRSIKWFLDCTEGIPQNHNVLRGGFTSLVYAIVDNTFHLFLTYYGWKIISL